MHTCTHVNTRACVCNKRIANESERTKIMFMSMQMGADRCGLLCRHVILGIELQENGSMVSTLELTPIRPA